jgi:hypothetical protein
MNSNKKTDYSEQQPDQKSLYEAYPHMRFTICRKSLKEPDVNNNWVRRLWGYFGRKA